MHYGIIFKDLKVWEIMKQVDERLGALAESLSLAIPAAGRAAPLIQHWQGSFPREAGWAVMTPTAEGLDCRAWFVDRDIYNEATRNNEFLFKFGDVAEFFIRPGENPDGSYYEFHVSPNNLSLSLRFPAPTEEKRSRAQVVACLFEPVGLRWQALIGSGGWGAHLIVPWAVFGLSARPAAGTIWLGSTSRYNYTRPATEPEYSATAPFTALSYHRVHEYDKLKL